MNLSWTLPIALYMLIGPSFAAQSAPPRRLALLSITKSDVTIPQVRGLFDGLEEAGYVDGKNFAIHHLRSEDADKVRAHLQDLLRHGVDVIVATSAIETAIARQTTSEIPIVFLPAVDPVRLGFVKSRAHPGANLTGLSFTKDVEDNGKQLSVFKQIVPGLRRAIIFYDMRPASAASALVRASIKRVAHHVGIQIIETGVASSTDAVRALEQTPKGATDGVFPICTAVFRDMRPVARAAAQRNLPLFGCTAAQVADDGALITYTPDMYLIGYRGAWYVDRIFKGAKPGELPVEAPSKLELVINLKNARALGLTIPPERLILADKVFQ